MLDMAYYKYGLGELENPIIDTLMLSRVINRDLKKHSLKALGKFYGIDTGEADDEDEENVNETAVTGNVIDPEVGSAFASILIDGEEALRIEKQEYYDIDTKIDNLETQNGWDVKSLECTSSSYLYGSFLLLLFILF